MQLETRRLCLRPVVASDVADLFRIYGDPATNQFNPAGPYPDIQHAQAVLNRWVEHWVANGFGNWAISLLDSPEDLIGFGGLSILSYTDKPFNNLGYRFATEAWGKGLATEFAEYAVRYGFEVIKLAEVNAVVRANHLASQKVLQKAGLSYVRDIDDVKDAPPSMLYALLFDDWHISKSMPG
ncbi:GNAT family acetyltransferase [Raoultella terrigena]|uniref:Anhydro-N-acetylmuramic acid kinase n=1 Tax=Raoultella terrigena TaxID=577 RepID=A0A485CFZ4_RAOTE|nr:GNAT family N-acetyltransferase [Raoultella terrigena]GEC68743.1 GNAT family acetyltransferase [Raoultella terrigena]VFS83636.1 anhydro-N-acetylmuramic acid kinase [Raoultella terrigena]